MKSLTLAFVFAIGVLFSLPSSAVAAEDGKTLFTSNKCAMCHGDNGKGNEKTKGMVKGDMTKLDLTDSGTKAKTDADLAKAISDGVKPMKAYKELSPDQISALVKYIRSLK